MKRVIIYFAAIFMMLPSYAQSNSENYTHALKRISLSNGEPDNWVEYYYNDLNQPIAKDSEYTIDSLFYNSQGQLIKYSYYDKEEQYQNIEYFLLSYNAEGQRTKMEYYYAYEGSPIKEATREYTYEGDRLVKIVQTTLYDDYLEVEYTYDDNNNCTEQLINEYYEGVLDFSQKVVYAYDDDNNKVSASLFILQYEEWVLDSKIENQFDEIGNCVVETHYEGETKEGEYRYTYNTDILADNVVVANFTEEDWPCFEVVNTNVPIKAAYYEVDETGELVYQYDRNYEYVALSTPTDDINTTMSVIYPNPAKDIININSADYNRVEIYNTIGMIVYSSDLRGAVTIDLGGFARGMYYVKLLNGNSSVTQKMVVE